jgi:hypothetical protein
MRIYDAQGQRKLGDLTINPDSTVATIVANAVTDVKLRDSAALSVIGRSANNIGDPADIVASADKAVLHRDGTALAFSPIDNTYINDFIEAAQDAVGGILTNTATIEFTYDGTPAISADLSAAVLASLALADSSLQPGDNVSELVNDAGYLVPSDFAAFTFITESDETASFPASFRLDAGTNIAFDTSVPNVLTINASGGGGTGTVTSIAAGTGISASPDPIVTTGTLAIDQSFTPTWTGLHTFAASNNVFTGVASGLNFPLILSSATPGYMLVETDAPADSGRWREFVTGSIRRFQTATDAGGGGTNWMDVTRSGTTVSSIALASTALTWNGNPLLSTVTAFANPTATIGLAASNGSATTAMRSDAAPALSQSIAPTWTGQHIFTHGLGITIQNTTPLFAWVETDAAANNGRWWAVASGEQFTMRAVNDTGSSSTSFMAVDRSNNTIDSINLAATTITLSGAPTSTGSHTFLANATGARAIKLQNASSTNMAFEITGAGVNEKYWLMNVAASSWSLLTRTDVDGVGATPILVTRSGTTVPSIAFAATTVTVNGTNVRDAGIITSGTLPVARGGTGTTTSTGTGSTVRSASPTFTGTLAADAITANTFNGHVLNAGTYTPTATVIGNLDSVTPQVCQWLRVGNVVTVSGEITVDPTAAALTSFRITLPVASNLASLGQLAGTGFANYGPPPNSVLIRGDAINDAATFTFQSTGAVSTGLYFSFTYLVV